MVDEFLLDEMDLPLVNPNEELETVSNNYFKPLFDVSKWTIKTNQFFESHQTTTKIDLVIYFFLFRQTFA